MRHEGIESELKKMVDCYREIFQRESLELIDYSFNAPRLRCIARCAGDLSAAETLSRAFHNKNNYPAFIAEVKLILESRGRNVKSLKRHLIESEDMGSSYAFRLDLTREKAALDSTAKFFFRINALAVHSGLQGETFDLPQIVEWAA